VDINLESLLIKIKQCTLQHLDTAAIIELAGTADMEQQLDVALKWQQLQWPVNGTAEYSSATGNVSLTGTVDDFHLLGKTTLSGNAIPDTAIQLTTAGNRESVRDMQLTLNSLEGQLIVRGDAEWAPAVKWQVHTKAQHLNPGAYFTQWPGELNWLVQSDGHLEESGVFANVVIDHLQGHLRDYPIAGTGKINIAADTIQIDKLLLSSGDATMRAEGLLGEVSDLKWKLDIPDFADLLPDSSGKLNGSGTILGKMATPKLELQIAGKNIALPQGAIQQLQLQAGLDLSWEETFKVNLVAMDLQSGENQLQKVTLQSKGLLTKHTINFFASHELADVSLDLAGGYEAEQWHGVLENLLIDSDDMGKWQNRTPTKITAGTQSATLEPLCLSRETSDICMHGNWDKENTNTEGNVSLTGLPLSWFSTWFPENLDDLGGVFSFEAKAAMQDKLQATAQARITPGEIIYNTEKKQGTLSHEGLNLDLLIADDGLDADLWLSVDSNIISGKLKSPDLLKTGQKQSPTIDGKININANNFQLVEKLVSDVQNVQAQIDTDFSIQGTLAQPKVHGAGKIHINTILIPVVGLELSDTSLDILADNSQLKINGMLNSPKGSMAIDGLALLDAEKNYPASITLKGKNFRLVNLPDIQIYLSSDILIDKKKELTTLSGTVTIPTAEILLRELPKGTTTASPDIVILQQKKKEEPKAPMQMNLKIGLGNKVHFVGFGLNAFVDGQLNITAEPNEQMLGSGAFYIKQGNYRAYGQDLDIETGVISFPGGPLTQPGINLRATRTVGNIVAGISAIGPVSKPRITTFSRPSMSESLTLSYLVTGSAPNAGGGTKLSLERQINSKLNVSVGTDIKSGESEFITRYRLSRKIFLQTTTASSSNAADIFYTTEFGGEEKKEEE
jgi:translocation and assembly module TamB